MLLSHQCTMPSRISPQSQAYRRSIFQDLELFALHIADLKECFHQSTRSIILLHGLPVLAQTLRTQFSSKYNVSCKRGEEGFTHGRKPYLRETTRCMSSSFLDSVNLPANWSRSGFDHTIFNACRKLSPFRPSCPRGTLSLIRCRYNASEIDLASMHIL